MKRILCLVLLSLGTISLAHAQHVPACVHGAGISYLLDWFSAGIFKACNCQKDALWNFGIPPCDVGYDLYFEDNFNGNSLDLSEWEIQPWGQGALQGNAFMEYNSLDNVTVSGGTCKIIAKKETVFRKAVSWLPSGEIVGDNLPNARWYYYTSSSIWTKKTFWHGKYEIRARMPAGNGFWPAFWMYGGQRWNEIDVFDNYAGVNTLVTGIGHDYNGNLEAEGCNNDFSGFDFTQWHTFTCLFDFDKITWQIDGNTVHILYRFLTINGNILECGDEIGQGAIMNLQSWPLEPMHIILNMALNSETGHTPVDNTTPFPSSFEIDYVRMWKRDDCCPDLKLFEKTENLSTLTHVENYIKAGNDAGIPDVSGNVIVKSGQNITFKAGNFIELLPGFETETGALFTAEIEECNIVTHPSGGTINIVNFPTLFTPNNDNVNDELCISVKNAQHYSVEVIKGNQTIFTASGDVLSDPICVWDGAGACNGAYLVTVLFTNCDDSEIQSKVVSIIGATCKTDSTGSGSEDSIENIYETKTELLIDINAGDSASNHITIHPNPTTGEFTLTVQGLPDRQAGSEFNVQSFIYIYDILGRLIEQLTMTDGQSTIDISLHPKGIYLVKVVQGGHIYTEKLIRQ